MAVFTSSSLYQPWSGCFLCFRTFRNKEGRGISIPCSFSVWPQWFVQFQGKEQGMWEGILTFLLSLLAGLQTDPEAGEHHGTEEGEPVVGETHQAGEAPTVFGP